MDYITSIYKNFSEKRKSKTLAPRKIYLTENGNIIHIYPINPQTKLTATVLCNHRYPAEIEDKIKNGGTIELNTFGPLASSALIKAIEENSPDRLGG